MQIDPNMVSEDRFVLAFYGIGQSAEACKGFFNIAREWVTQLGYAPDKLGVHGNGHSGKVGDYRRSLRKLEKTGFSEVGAFSMYTCLPNAKSPAAEFYAAASFSLNARHGGYAIVAVPSPLAGKCVWLPFVLNVIDVVRPAYGIGFNRPLRQGPIFYALGTNISQTGDAIPTGEAYEERRNISFWTNAMMKKVYRDGLLRYVYPWNFLTRPQLDRQVEGISLSDWINADASRGVLEHISEVWLWEVGESQLGSIRERLCVAGAVFDWRKYFNVDPHVKTTLA
jgi:hypothetical protein